MSHREVKKVISSQVMMVFSFPLVVAVIHLGFAFPLIKKLLVLFGLVNWKLFLLICGIVTVIFAILYFIVYRLTARSYYQLVERKELKSIGLRTNAFLVIIISMFGQR